VILILHSTANSLKIIPSVRGTISLSASPMIPTTKLENTILPVLPIDSAIVALHGL